MCFCRIWWQLQESLEDTRITAPCSGTVTAVYAEVGSTGSGLLFIIEDVDDLVGFHDFLPFFFGYTY